MTYLRLKVLKAPQVYYENMQASNKAAVRPVSPGDLNPELGNQQAGLNHRNDIDGLRALAVIAVILFHLDDGPQWLPGGFIGVDVFFVISGYVVTGSLLRSRPPTTTEYFLAFYARQLKRLSPALVLVTCITGLLIALLIDPAAPATASYYESGFTRSSEWPTITLRRCLPLLPPLAAVSIIISRRWTPYLTTTPPPQQPLSRQAPLLHARGNRTISITIHSPTHGPSASKSSSTSPSQL